MKNTTKFDKFMLFGIMIFLMIGASLTCKSCQAKPSIDVPVMEYGDCEDGIMSCDTIDLYLHCIEGFGYDPYTGKYFIEYIDDDAFDYDNLVEYTDYDEWPTSFIPIECTCDEFIEFIKYYNSVDKSSDEYQFGYNKTYAMVEIHYNDNIHKACIFRLVKR